MVPSLDSIGALTTPHYRAVEGRRERGLLLHVALREGVVVICLRQVGDLPPHLVHVLQPERTDAASVLGFLDLADPVGLFVLFGRRMRGVDLGRGRDRKLEAVLRPLLLLLALDADADHPPGPALPQILPL